MKMLFLKTQGQSGQQVEDSFPGQHPPFLWLIRSDRGQNGPRRGELALAVFEISSTLQRPYGGVGSLTVFSPSALNW